MKQYIVRSARQADLKEILRIYAIAREFMVQTGNPTQWAGAYPARELLEQDIQKGNLYAVLEGDMIRGVFYFAVEADPTYARIEDGAWFSDAAYGVIHRIASDGSGGVFGACLRYCLEEIPHLRIDTHHDNRVMQHVVEKHGFRRCGVIYVSDGSPRIAYERI